MNLRHTALFATLLSTAPLSACGPSTACEQRSLWAQRDNATCTRCEQMCRDQSSAAPSACESELACLARCPDRSALTCGCADRCLATPACKSAFDALNACYVSMCEASCRLRDR